MNRKAFHTLRTTCNNRLTHLLESHGNDHASWQPQRQGKRDLPPCHWLRKLRSHGNFRPPPADREDRRHEPAKRGGWLFASATFLGKGSEGAEFSSRIRPFAWRTKLILVRSRIRRKRFSSFPNFLSKNITKLLQEKHDVKYFFHNTLTVNILWIICEFSVNKYQKEYQKLVSLIAQQYERVNRVVLGISAISRIPVTLTKDDGIFLKKKFFEFSNFRQRTFSEFHESQDAPWLTNSRTRILLWICKGFSFRFSWRGRPYVSLKKPPRTLLKLTIRAVWQKLCNTRSKGNGRNFSTNPYPSQSLPKKRVCNIPCPEKNPIRVGMDNGTTKDS